MSNRLVFVDTSAWYALVDKSDHDHRSALNSVRNLTHPLITTNYVLDETLTLIKVKLGPRIAIEFGRKLWNQELPAGSPLLKRMSKRPGACSPPTMTKDSASPIALPLQSWNV